MVRTWDESRRQEALSATEQALADPDFEPNSFERRYGDPAIDDTAHSGESLLALHKVLKAFADQ